MRNFRSAILILATAVALVHANEGDASTSYLPAIIGSATDNCQGPCDDIVGVIQQCTDASPADDDLEVARCACSISTLGVIRNCASCVSQDKKAKSGNQALGWYNAYVNQCISLTLTDSSMLTSVPGQIVTTATALTTFVRPSMTPGPGIITSVKPAASSSSSYNLASSIVDELSSQVSAASQSAAAEASQASPKVQAASGASRQGGAGVAIAVLAAVAAVGVLA